jgi:hypothetical protein
MNAARDIHPPGLGVLGRTEKICATENAVSLGQTEGICPTGKEKGPIPLKPFSAENATTEVPIGKGFTRQLNEKWPVECWHSLTRVALIYCQ